ncbi:NEL domain-containing protein [Pseudomonas xanthosomatis]|nr:NEL domain-containing protein [Pseudomonas xanthosomatis]QXH48034.1 NEL domain-containing protein [Pseudomonas xanthosomatis]
MWHRLQAETQALDLFIFIADLANSTDFRATPQAYRGRIWRILEACDLHETLRVRAFTEAGGGCACEDRLLLILSQLETAVLAEEAVAGGPASQVESYARERYAERFEALEQEASSGARVAGSDALRRELELQKQQLLKRLARKAYDRTQP